MTVRTLVFDLGGVLMLHDHTRLRPYFSRMPREILEAYGLGNITTGTFLTETQRAIPELSQAEIADIWVSLHAGIPAERLEQVRRWREQMPCFVLSNNDDLHWRHIVECVPDMEQRFDGIVLSHEVHLRKPDPAICELTDRMIADWHRERKMDYDPHETLFIDDLAANTEAAAQYGWQTLNRYEDIQNTLLQ